MQGLTISACFRPAALRLTETLILWPSLVYLASQKLQKKRHLYAYRSSLLGMTHRNELTDSATFLYLYTREQTIQKKYDEISASEIHRYLKPLVLIKIDCCVLLYLDPVH